MFDRLENIVAKGEIACQKASFPDPSKGVIVWKWVKSWGKFDVQRQKKSWFHIDQQIKTLLILESVV